MTDVVRSLDLTGPRAPALSATSDMPDVGTPAEAPKGAVSDAELAAGGTEAAKAGDKPADDATDPGDKPPGDAPAEADAKPKDETKPWVKAEITKARNRQRDAEALAAANAKTAAETKAQLDKALAALEKIGDRTAKEEQRTDVEAKPKRTDFDDPEKYDEALIAWSAKVAAAKTAAELELKRKTDADAAAAEQKKTEQAAYAKERVDKWVEDRTKALEKYADFAEKVEADDMPFNDAMRDSIFEQNFDEPGIGPEIAYYLATHLDEATAISKLTTQSAVDRRIGKIAALVEIELKKPAPISKTPPPPKPLGGRQRATEKTNDEKSTEEYAATHWDPAVRARAAKR